MERCRVLLVPEQSGAGERRRSETFGSRGEAALCGLAGGRSAHHHSMRRESVK